MMPTGTLTRKMERQPRPAMSPLVSSAPRMGPPTVAMPPSAPNMPTALPRPLGAYIVWMTARTWGTMRAAMIPCATRAAISSVEF